MEANIECTFAKYLPQIKEITMDNAKLLLQIDNTNLTNNDLKNKYSSRRLAPWWCFIS